MIANSLGARGNVLPKRRYVPIFAALIISCGLRLSGTNGPNTSCLRSTRNSAAAFFCASVSLSAGIGGSRSCANAGDAQSVSTASAAHTLPAASVQPPALSLPTARCLLPAACMSSSQFRKSAREPLDPRLVDEVVAGAIFLEIAADDQAVDPRQHPLDVFRRRAAADEDREAGGRPDRLDVRRAGFD